LKKHFEIIEEKHCGGAILHTLLTNIAGNFKSDNEDDMKLLKAEGQGRPSDYKFSRGAREEI